MLFFNSVSPIFAEGNAANSLIYAFTHSDPFGQAICIFLIIVSVIVWSIMITIGKGLKKSRKGNEDFIRKFDSVRNPLGLRDQVKDSPSPAANVYVAACERIQSFKLETPRGGRRAMTDDELQMVRYTVDVAIEDQLNALERNFVWLAVCVSGGPFVGLFGTVWGITIAFAHLAQLGRADVNALAPGISGALLTTVLGLVVAIPSMVGYNFVLNLRQQIEIQLDRFADNLNAKFKLEQLESIAKFSATQQRGGE